MLNLILYGEGSSMETKMAVVIMLVGVTMATVTDVDVGPVGFAIGMAAVIGAAQQQIFIGKIQKRLGASVRRRRARAQPPPARPVLPPVPRAARDAPAVHTPLDRCVQRCARRVPRAAAAVSAATADRATPRRGASCVCKQANQLLVSYTPFVVVMLAR